MSERTDAGLPQSHRMREALQMICDGAANNPRFYIKEAWDVALWGLGKDLPQTGAHGPAAICRHGVHPYDCKEGCRPDGSHYWQPIETAPKDSTVVLLYSPGSIQQPSEGVHFIHVSYWVNEQHEVWDTVDDDTMKRHLRDDSHWASWEEPTHWAPLPPFPVSP